MRILSIAAAVAARRQPERKNHRFSVSPHKNPTAPRRVQAGMWLTATGLPACNEFVTLCYQPSRRFSKMSAEYEKLRGKHLVAG